ncbi:DNA-directed RNA polymerase subunit K [Candidatus Pacearchaeota archaeon CG10_big_fil_rev_8_21_14_0_10_32_14]|nr:MAG: DNA-directed RNA polymerase subunit K [Candidatus Pacearchaeota archaeon CG10_big_fil_rev_8_21_14_0_10_32_14]
MSSVLAPEVNIENMFSKYEIARIIGARALQISMNAPLLIKIDKADLEKIQYDPIKIAEVEFRSGVLPITVKKPFPMKKEGQLKRVKERVLTDEEKAKIEEAGEEDVEKEGEIMELAQPDDEVENDEAETESERE